MTPKIPGTKKVVPNEDFKKDTLSLARRERERERERER
jgi:hypothetical protein